MSVRRDRGSRPPRPHSPIWVPPPHVVAPELDQAAVAGKSMAEALTGSAMLELPQAIDLWEQAGLQFDSVAEAENALGIALAHGGIDAAEFSDALGIAVDNAAAAGAPMETLSTVVPRFGTAFAQSAVDLGVFGNEAAQLGQEVPAGFNAITGAVEEATVSGETFVSSWGEVLPVVSSDLAGVTIYHRSRRHRQHHVRRREHRGDRCGVRGSWAWRGVLLLQRRDHRRRRGDAGPRPRCGRRGGHLRGLRDRRRRHHAGHHLWDQ